MAETVQCPVCTLYLHAGMNLSDHLETHPKEQVIRALVQMTISGSGVGNSNNNILSSVLNANTTNKQSSELEKPPSTVKDKELDFNCAGHNASKPTSISSLSNQSGNNSQNLKTAHKLYEMKTEPQNENEHEKMPTLQTVGPVKTVVETETTNTVAMAKINVVTNENVSQCFSKQSYNQTISVSSSTTNASHSYRNSIELANTTSVHNNFNVFGANNRYEQQRSNNSNHNQLATPPHMPPPPPPPPPPPLPPPNSSQIEHSGQHPDTASRGILPVDTNGTFHSIQPQQLPPPPPPHHTTSHLGSSGSLRQSHLYQPGQHQHPPTNSHHTQSLKVIYTPNLPPPPPLQLFTYQPQNHLQPHQKPPPAYGTAISQIRSQHNQSKHQVTGPLSTQQHQNLPAHSVLQQQLVQHHLQQDQTSQQNLRIQIPPSPSQLPIPEKSICSQKNNDLSNQILSTTSRLIQNQQYQQQSKVDLSQRQQHQQQQEQEQQLQLNSQSSNSLNNPTFNSNEVINKSPSKTKSAATLQNPNLNATVPPSYPQVSISPSAASASMASVAASTLARHTNSPFAALLAAAAGAPSPSNTSSVLRYAESPVAHYLERENGDFIVQETPKHIVECVETDNGEFSVIERIYQSPPSVLHIHDEDDDDDDDEDDERKDKIEDEKLELPDAKSKQHDIVDKELGKNRDKRDIKQNKPSCKDAKIKKLQTQSHFDDKISTDDEIIDFVSISSESSDDEEFISQRQKDHKNTTVKSKKNRLTLSLSTTSIQSTSSISSTIATTTDDDNQAPLSSTSTPLLTSSSSSAAMPNPVATQHSYSNNTTNSTVSRKKSSKNTITVLSDVQLNLNEYLDLVGNIIASSKVASQRKTLTSIAPIPLVKIEKEEPMDDYIANTTASTDAAPPLNSNKHETEEITDIPRSSCDKQTTNNKNIVANELEQDEKEEKKPQVFLSTSENEIAIAISSASPSHMSINSSQVTSVIRMATTSQHQQQGKQSTSMESIKNSNEAEDLSQPHQKVQSAALSKTLSHTPLARKGPKKLIIKPKSTKTEVLLTTTTESKPNQNRTINDQEFPSTSACTQEEHAKESSTGKDVSNITDIKIKNEPITSTTYGNLQQQPQFTSGSSFSILEHHLSSKEPILEFKEEKPCITEASLPSSSIIKEMKTENNVNDDARVLYDFANSKKSQNETTSTFPSSKSLFSSKQPSPKITLVDDEINKNIILENESTSSTYSSQSIIDASMPPEEQNESSTASVSVAHAQHQTIPMYNDFHFNYLYNNIGSNITIAAEQADIKNPQFSSFYQNSANDNNNIMLQEDSSSSKHYTDYQQLQSNHSHLQQHQHIAAASHDQWFNTNNYHTAAQNVSPISSNQSVCNVNSGLSIDGDNGPMDGSETSKYLDLDSCKREQNINLNPSDRVLPPPPPSSSTSCSFNGTAENSMAGVCSSAATLNIRTDEKMPAKGEISEQESNCDIDNSWSQPMYGDISARFFKTTFPAIFPPDSGWNHDEYFTVQDLSASTNVSGTTSTSNRMKSFDQTSSNNSNAIPIFSQNSNDNCNMDVMPSTSAKIRKKRKRSSQEEKSFLAIGRRMQPTSTVTSQEMLNQHQNEMAEAELNFQNQSQHQLQQQDLQTTSTSTSFLAGPSNAGNALATGFMMQQQQQQSQTQQKQRTKVYECGHCNAKYSKLKDRNAHMIDIHNYIRQNRRLVCPTTGLVTTLGSSDNQEIALPTTSAASTILTSALQNDNGAGDFKQSIVKIENENPHRDVSGIEPINADLCAKAEMEEDKHNLDIVSTNATAKIEAVEYDSKPLPGSFPLSITTPSNKLTTLYRMLVSFNMTTLKQHQTLSELDENLIKSSMFFCYTCRQNFNSVKLYDAHLTEHPAECFTCGKKFQRWKNFSLHLKRHLGWKEFGCTVCDKKFVVRSALVEHMRMHSGLSPLKCKFCGKHFKRYSNLTQHRKRHTKQITRHKEYVCYCGEVLPSKARFLWHKEIHDSKPKCCPHCCDRFVHVNSLRRHIRLAHSDKFDYTEPMECSICKQIFAKASMKAHMATHSTETQYDCAICNKSFSTKWNLKIHSWVHANRTTKPFKCEHCPKAFVREVDFKNHMNSHKQIKPYTCEVCGCKFIRKYNYMRHRREHHGNKKYTCDLCKKSFHRHYYLIEHRRIHTGERPFQCSICGKSSTTKTNHNKHLKIHHSRDPFTVEV